MVGRVGTPQRCDAVGGRAAGGGGTAVEQRGDLGVGQPRQVVIGDRLALFGGQRGNRFGQLEVTFVGVIVRRPVRCVRDRYRPPRRGPDDVDCLAVGDRNQPRLEVGIGG